MKGFDQSDDGRVKSFRYSAFQLIGSEEVGFVFHIRVCKVDYPEQCNVTVSWELGWVNRWWAR